MSTVGKTSGQAAVSLIKRGESKAEKKLKKIGNFNCKEFGRFVGLWMLTAIIMFLALLLITITKNPENILVETIKKVDTLNMTFSLVLSALLEQVWSKGSYKGMLYSVTLGAESILTIMGAMLYVAYSIVESENYILKISFKLNLGYIIITIIVVILGFVSRALCDERVEGGRQC